MQHVAESGIDETGAMMIDEIALRRDELRAVCRRFHVRRLDLFGSAARGDFDPQRSDVDFLVEFDRTHPDALSLRTYSHSRKHWRGFWVGRSIWSNRAPCAIRT